MTHATKSINKLLLLDYIKVGKVSVEDMLYDEQDISRLDKIEVCAFLVRTLSSAHSIFFIEFCCILSYVGQAYLFYPSPLSPE